MDVIWIILIALAVVVLLFFVGGLVYNRRRLERPEWEEHVMRADAALEAARAADRGWDRVVMEEAARKALAEQRPDFEYDAIHLVLVEDRPGVAEDAAEFMAVGRDGDTRVTLVRHDDGGWRAESVG